MTNLGTNLNLTIQTQNLPSPIFCPVEFFPEAVPTKFEMSATQKKEENMETPREIYLSCIWMG